MVRQKKNEIINFTNLQNTSKNQINSLQEENAYLYVKCKNYEEKYKDNKQCLQPKNENNKKKNPMYN